MPRGSVRDPALWCETCPDTPNEQDLAPGINHHHQSTGLTFLVSTSLKGLGVGCLLSITRITWWPAQVGTWGAGTHTLWKWSPAHHLSAVNMGLLASVLLLQDFSGFFLNVKTNTAWGYTLKFHCADSKNTKYLQLPEVHHKLRSRRR